jgi:FeS assembly SUF system protein
MAISKDKKKQVEDFLESDEIAVVEQKPAEKIADTPEKKAVRLKVIEALKTVHDPEIPVNIYDLGLIYDIAISDDYFVQIEMTLTAPACPVAHLFPSMVKGAVTSVEEVSDAEVEIVWDPPWTQDRMSEAAKLELGMF